MTHTTFQQPMVSVLTPVYNGERYLAECIESVLGQIYENWEYIIVNNCSTDRTLEIAAEYARRDSRIRIVNNSEFVSALRNHNIAATLMSRASQYCKFVQADDLIFPTCLSEMVRLAETHPSVGIVSSYQLQGTWVRCDGFPYPSTVMPGREVCRTFFFTRKSPFGNLSAFLIRTDLVRGCTPFLNEKYLCADWEVYFRVLQDYDYGFVHQVLSMWRIHDEALSSFAERHNQFTLDALHFIKQFGRIYLNPEEYEQCLQEALDRYYRCQGHELFHLREKGFWQYHRKMMNELGFSLSSLRLLKGAILVTADIVLEPFKAAVRPIRYIRSGQARLRPEPFPKRSGNSLAT